MTDFKTLIEQRLRELEDRAEASQAATATVELDQTRQGRLSRMDALQGQEMAKAAEQRRSVSVQRLKAALGRLERGEFGECLECGQPVAEARLRADPATTLCLHCAEDRERAR
ncbi:TraR/DksA family transcriptional regulator [Wenzhouxiangella limi]|uniref:TraR/DksA family transcriptional regulator n=1 Tax=Wenzhouxiangella limi TaxID=2707351 RepID=A0A845UXN4_9GAMM|nr:TraR/DksA C4-type zinc finger protein [Wenzhouxiangella limi]NDY95264.1 TraR/DksA family transcriptional regulator [Wenzhouxiangella limi]